MTSAFNRLVIIRASQISVERAGKDAPGNAVGGVAMRIVNGALSQDVKDAQAWVCDAIRALRAAPDARFDSDEAAAQAILDAIEKRRPDLIPRTP